MLPLLSFVSFFLEWSKILMTSILLLLSASFGHLENRHRHLGINIGINVGIGIGIAKSFYFCLSKFLMKKKSMVKSFSSILAHLPGSFSRCLERLFCRKPVSSCFWRKELHSRCYLRSFKKTHGWKLHFARL